MKNKPTSSKPPFENIRNEYYQKLHDINNAWKLWLSERTILKNLKFIEVCYHYNWSIHWLWNYLKEKEYLLKWNYWKPEDFRNELNKELKNFKSGTILIWYYFDKNWSIERRLLWSKIWKARILKEKYADLIDFFVNPLPKWL